MGPAETEAKAIGPKIVARYREALSSELVAVALFGSCARGDDTEKSDIDVLLIANQLPSDLFERQQMVKEPIWGLSTRRVSVLARTVDEFSADVSPLHLDLALDAVILYDSQHFLASKLARVRELIAEAGLARSADLRWKWHVQPKPGWAITWEGVSK